MEVEKPWEGVQQQQLMEEEEDAATAAAATGGLQTREMKKKKMASSSSGHGGDDEDEMVTELLMAAAAAATATATAEEDDTKSVFLDPAKGTVLKISMVLASQSVLAHRRFPFHCLPFIFIFFFNSDWFAWFLAYSCTTHPPQRVLPGRLPVLFSFG